jgi:signal transduction histidine kinase
LQTIQDRHPFNLQLTIDDVPLLPPDVQIALYRIVQESLNNIDKHARAQQVAVSVKDYDDRVELVINDDGEGFDVSTVRGTSLGLGIMHERAESIGASIQVESRKGAGTRITVIWHRHKQEQARL